MDDGLGFGFFAKMAGAVFAGGIILLIVFLIFTRALYAWGILGVFAVLAVVLLAFGWFYDRRQAQRRFAD